MLYVLTTFLKPAKLTQMAVGRTVYSYSLEESLSVSWDRAAV